MINISLELVATEGWRIEGGRDLKGRKGLAGWKRERGDLLSFVTLHFCPWHNSQSKPCQDVTRPDKLFIRPLSVLCRRRRYRFCIILLCRTGFSFCTTWLCTLFLLVTFVNCYLWRRRRREMFSKQNLASSRILRISIKYQNILRFVVCLQFGFSQYPRVFIWIWVRTVNIISI